MSPDQDAGLAILTLQCPDQPGIVAAVSALIAEAGGNIYGADQHTDRDSSVFLQRIELNGDIDWDIFRSGLAVLVERFGFEWSLHAPDRRHSIVVACSGELYCAADLLSRVTLGELECDVLGVISDKPAAAALAERHEVPFVLVDGGLAGSDRAAQEASFAAALETFSPELVVLARYMRILPAEITERWAGRMINIHHSFLPAFTGARPYLRAHQRGV